ncbi:MAG: asparaginase [Deltaproteobacteria bacterium]|nr:asparaginase [Deltaproteobacteria bacterium]
MATPGKVLMIYTGGTIGMLPAEEDNPLSPLVPANWDRLRRYVPVLQELPLQVDLHQMTLIDSSDMDPDYWVAIAQVIRDHYYGYDGFVILHGTDTMTYTATALSFLLENLSKPVILTGSQSPLGQPRSDAVQNLVTALMLASPRTFDLDLVPEVSIFFHSLLLRGNRTRKTSSSQYAGFRSPNFTPLARAGEHIQFNKKVIRGPAGDSFFIHERLEPNVIMLDVFPGLKPNILHRLFEIEGLKGVVLKTFGAGNTPTTKGFMSEIGYGIHRKNLTIVSVTQCLEGMVEMGRYDASAQLLRLGVISGVDMTPEAALVKMQFLLGLGYDGQALRDRMQQDLRGEQSVNVFNFLYASGTAGPLYQAQEQQLPANFNQDKIAAAHIRLDAVSLPKDSPEVQLDLAFFVNYPATGGTVNLTDEQCLAIPQCLGLIKKPYHGQSVNVVLDCTERFSRLIIPGQFIQFSVKARMTPPVHWAAAAISLHTSTDW